MLAADTDLETGLVVRPRSTPSRTSPPTPAVSMFSNGFAFSSPFEIDGHHPSFDVVSAEAEGHLGEVVRPEGEEVGFVGDLVRQKSGPWRLDHRADGDFNTGVRGRSALLLGRR